VGTAGDEGRLTIVFKRRIEMSLGLSWRREGLIAPLLLVAVVSSACLRSPEAKSTAAIEAGKKLLEQKDVPRAILQFRNAVQATPRNPEAYYQLALAYLAAGDARNGVASLRRTLELNPQHAAAQLQLAQLMASVDDAEVLKDAQGRLLELLKNAPGNPDTLHSLALTELKLGDPADAMQHLQLAMSAAPQELRIAVTLAQAKVQQKDLEGAEEVLRKLSDNSPQSAEAQTMLADFYASQNRMSEAETHLYRALEIDPKSGSAVLQLARLQLTEGRKQEAEQNFKRLEAFSGYESTYGIFLSQEGRHDESLREFERLAKEHPDDRQIRTRLVVSYGRVNRLDDARKIVGEALRKNGKDMEALLQRAELFLASKEYALAEADLNQVVKLQPDGLEVHYLLAKLNQARGNLLVYRQQLSQTVTLNPTLLAVRLELAQNLVNAKEGRAALDLLDGAPVDQRSAIPLLVQRNWALWITDRLPEMRKGIDQGLSLARTADLLVQDGLWKLRAGHPADARSALQQALKINPADLRALQGIRESYLAQQNAPMALREVKAFAAQHPESAPVQQFLGDMLMGAGLNKEARAAFEAAKAADPTSSGTQLSLVQIDMLEGKLDNARQSLDDIISKDKSNNTARHWLADVDTLLGQQGTAIQHFREVVTADSGNAEAYNNLAYLLIDQQPDEALKYAQKAVALAPDRPAYSDTLGWALYSKGLYAPAIQYLQRAAGDKKADAVWTYHLAMAYAKSGDLPNSRRTLQAALKQNPHVPEAKLAQELIRMGN
jgi:tetratricopeptide (TPR) repeat protein